MAAIRSTSFFLALVVTMALWETGLSQSQSGSCTSALVSLSPCLNYITGNSSSPSPSCCSQLASTVRAQPECLCQVLQGGASSSMGLNINRTQALAMPAACNVQTPPPSSCNGAASPNGSPSETPVSDTPAGTGSKTVPTTDAGTSDGSSTKMSVLLVFFASLAVAYASAGAMF